MYDINILLKSLCAVALCGVNEKLYQEAVDFKVPRVLYSRLIDLFHFLVESKSLVNIGACHLLTTWLIHGLILMERNI